MFLGRGGRTHLYGKMGYKGRVLETGRRRWRRMEFFICFAPASQPALLPRGTHFTSDGMGGITFIFLRSIGNGKGRSARLL
jgi:hypothetical protein